MNRYFTVLFFSLISISLYSQDLNYARKIVDTLCSESFGGRGYSYNGDWKAAQFIKNEFIKLGIKPLFNEYEQAFLLSANTFPGAMAVEVGSKKLIPGKDYLVQPFSGSQNGIYSTLSFKKNVFLKTNKFFKQISKSACKNRVLVINKDQFTTKEEKEKYNDCLGLIKQFDGFELAGVVELSKEKLTWSISTKYTGIAFLQVVDSIWPEQATEVYINIEHRFEEVYTSQNVFGFIEGSHFPDSFIVLTAHYDHLGHMGKDTYFAGANDNASGISMLLSLAKHYAELKDDNKYSILFIAFGAEEAGLIGSKYFVNHPIFPLNNIKFLINMDLMGTGEDGLMVVNGKVFEKQYDLLCSINKEHDFFPVIKKRGKAANSDHYYFSEKGVPSFFLYTLGGIKAYHDIYDVAKTLPLNKFKESHQLIRTFIKALEPELQED